LQIFIFVRKLLKEAMYFMLNRNYDKNFERNRPPKLDTVVEKRSHCSRLYEPHTKIAIGS